MKLTNQVIQDIC